MKIVNYILISICLLFNSCSDKPTRTIEDFNSDWKFSLKAQGEPEKKEYDDSNWETVRIPHDWSNNVGYTSENTAASTGFSEGGVGWYRKTFTITKLEQGRTVWVEFDGVYCNSEVFINGRSLGKRANGYSSFSYNLSQYLNYGGQNVVSVKVDHKAYADSRWYTGSGIYRDVRLVKTNSTYIPQWGVKITTPKVDNDLALVHVETQVKGGTENTQVEVAIYDEDNELVASTTDVSSGKGFEQDLLIANPKRWGTESPTLYTAKVMVKENGETVDETTERFGIREFRFYSNKGFYLNGKNMKLKGVNLHHDAGAVGAAANKSVWEYRVKQLKDIGVNAIRMAHNPHSPQLMEVCDEMGMLVMNEFFDEWNNAKAKSVNCLGGQVAGQEIAEGYSDVFFENAERDLKDLIRRDYNHPSVILWSIGNEIEWTFPAYSEAYSEIEGDIGEYVDAPTYDNAIVKPIFDRITGGIDSCTIIATKLSKWVKEEDTTRPVICGSVRPTIAFASGYADQVDILGLNYRAIDYDGAHEAFPEKCLIGSENWVAYSEWKACMERDFIPGIFVWTGFAYRGEGGPWPRKGLNISLFDFAGFKNPRGHFFECLWKDDPKVYTVTTPASDSEFSLNSDNKWEFDIQYTAPPVWNKLRLWEWYKVNEHWNYKNGEEIVVQTYTNCEEAELFLNGKSFGKQSLSDFSETDNIIKWMVPFNEGELKVVGYNNGEVAEKYVLNSTNQLAEIQLSVDKSILKADHNDLSHITAKLYDEAGNEIKDLDTEIVFNVDGVAEVLAVDNGWEMNVSTHYSNKVKTHNGKALALVQSTNEKGETIVNASIGSILSNELRIMVK